MDCLTGLNSMDSGLVKKADIKGDADEWPPTNTREAARYDLTGYLELRNKLVSAGFKQLPHLRVEPCLGFGSACK